MNENKKLAALIAEAANNLLVADDAAEQEFARNWLIWMVQILEK